MKLIIKNHKLSKGRNNGDDSTFISYQKEETKSTGRKVPWLPQVYSNKK